MIQTKLYKPKTITIEISGTQGSPQEIPVIHDLTAEEAMNFVKDKNFDAFEIKNTLKTTEEFNAFIIGMILARHLCALTVLDETKGIESGMKLAKKLDLFEVD